MASTARKPPRRALRRWNLSLRKPPPSPIRLHPQLAEAYRHRVANLARHLTSEDGRTEALGIVLSLIELVGELASMVEVALAIGRWRRKQTALRDAERRSVKVVAGAGFEPAAFRL
jgi:site-specific DNA recombinase